MKKIPVYFILPNLSISGVLTFCENAIDYINNTSSRYEASLLITGSSAGAEICKVPVVQLCKSGNNTGLMIKTLIEFLNKHEKAVIVPNYMFSLIPSIPFLHRGIMRLFILHSDEQIYYDTARLMCSNMDRLVCVSGYIRDKLVGEDPQLSSKTCVVPYGIEVPEKLPLKQTDAPIQLIYSGRLLEYQKRVSRLAEIVLKLDAITKDYRFTFIGDGSSAPLLKEQLAAQVAAGNVVFTGRVLREEINTWLSASDIFVLTSDFEGTPLALLEAMAYGCVPVVNRISSGIPEVIDEGECGYIIDNCDIDGFISTITALKGERKALACLSEKAYEKALLEYSTPVMGGRFIDVFDSYFNSSQSETPVKELSSEIFACLLPWLYEEKIMSFIRFFRRIAVFGCGAAGQASLAFLNDTFPGRCVMMIDDNFKGSLNDLPVVTTDEFLADYLDEIDLVVYGAYQNVNQKLLEYTDKPHIRMDNIV